LGSDGDFAVIADPDAVGFEVEAAVEFTGCGAVGGRRLGRE